MATPAYKIDDRDKDKEKALGRVKRRKWNQEAENLIEIRTASDMTAEEKREAEDSFREVLSFLSKMGTVRQGAKELLRISHTSIWNWKNGREPITQKGLFLLRSAVEEIRKIEKQQRQQSLNLEQKKIIKMGTTRIISELLEECVQKKIITIVNGQSGRGKTTSLNEILAAGDYEPFVSGLRPTEGKIPYILLIANQFTGYSDMLRKISAGLGLHTKGNSSQLIDRVAGFLANNPILIVIDESDWWQRYNWLNCFRTIWQQARTPIFLLGTPRFMQDLNNPEDHWRQLNSRIAVKYCFEAISFEEMQPFFQDYGDESWSREIREEIYVLSAGSLHDLLLMIDKVKSVAAINPEVAVTPAFVRQVKRQFLS